MKIREVNLPLLGAQGEARESDAELARELLMIARAIGGRPVYGSFRTVESVCERAAQRLSAKAEISEAMLKELTEECEQVAEGCEATSSYDEANAWRAVAKRIRAALSSKEE